MQEKVELLNKDAKSKEIINNLELKISYLDDERAKTYEKLNDAKLDNDFLTNSLKEITEKYESLRDLDSPIKEVSQMKKLIKKNDETIKLLKQENSDYQKKSKQLENKTQELAKNLEEKNMKIISLEEENERVKSIYEDVKEKYESLRDVDSPVKEVSQMKKVLKQN